MTNKGPMFEAQNMNRKSARPGDGANPPILAVRPSNAWVYLYHSPYRLAAGLEHVLAGGSMPSRRKQLTLRLSSVTSSASSDSNSPGSPSINEDQQFDLGLVVSMTRLVFPGGVR